MKNFLYIVFILGISIHVNGQNQVNGIVDYHFVINNPDGSTFANPFKMYFDQNTTYYTKVGTVREVSDKSKKVSVGLNDNVVTKNIMKSNLPQPFYYTNTKNQELISRQKIVRAMYLVEDILEPISWKLQQKHKKIANYNCQKAIAKYRGREYTVWFTTEIPVSHGPWKLRGLPGLILEVTEETGKYGFVANAVNLNPDKELLQKKIKKPDTKGITTMENYIEAIKNKYKNTMAMARASLPRGARLATDCDICPDPKNYSLERFD